MVLFCFSLENLKLNEFFSSLSLHTAQLLIHFEKHQKPLSTLSLMLLEIKMFLFYLVPACFPYAEGIASANCKYHSIKAQHNDFRTVTLTLWLCQHILLTSIQLRTCGVSFSVRYMKVGSTWELKTSIKDAWLQ